MSQYPYGYGQYPAQPPPNQYPYQSSMPYPPSVYGGPHDRGAAPEGYYAMNQNAYTYNQLPVPGIPGLGIAGTPTAGSPYHPPPPPPPPAAAASPWGQLMYQHQGPPFTAGTPAAAPTQYAVPPPHHIPTPPVPPATLRGHALQAPPQNNQALSRSAVPNLNSMQTQSSEEMEEGELSEGQFEDLYEPREAVSRSKQKAVAVSIPPPVAEPSRPGSAVDTPDAGFYTEEDGENKNRPGASNGPGAGNASNGQQEPSREKSGSYSPYLSPREIQGDSTPNNAARSPQIQPQSSTASLPGFHVQASGQVRVPGLGGQSPEDTLHASSELGPSKSSLSLTQAAPSNKSPAAAPAASMKSLVEARKEAQKAILRLWPMGVKFQHYVDEGIDENVVKRLFTDLHLDMSTGKPTESKATQPAPQTKSTEPPKPVSLPASAPATEKQPPVHSQSGTKPANGKSMDKSEERKDRIARLLAAKAAKGPAPAPASVPAVVPPSAPTAPAVVSPPIATKTSQASTPSTDKPVKSKEDIERLLRQKMEALQKARAQKADADKTVPSPANLSGSGAATPVASLQSATALGAPQQQQDHPVPAGSSSAIPTGPRSSLPSTVPTGPRSSVPTAIPSDNQMLTQLRPSPRQQPEQDLGPIPGLFLSSGSQLAAPVTHRKRPVAADFVGYSSAPKRPFGQERQDSSLVIDISDGSDEEMDIEMDMDSPTETPLVLPRTNSIGQKGLPFGNFPPLTDTRKHQTASPAPTTHTPPVFMSKKEQELMAKEKAIQEMRRKIAEAEAKRKAKQASSGTQTPNPPTMPLYEPNGSESSGGIDPRANSTGVANHADASSAQPVSEAHEARQEAEKPPHAVSVAVPAVDAAAQEKERRKRERAEKARKLQEELARIQAEMDAEEDMSEEELSAEQQVEQIPVEKHAEGNIVEVPASQAPRRSNEPPRARAQEEEASSDFPAAHSTPTAENGWQGRQIRSSDVENIIGLMVVSDIRGDNDIRELFAEEDKANIITVWTWDENQKLVHFQTAEQRDAALKHLPNRMKGPVSRTTNRDLSKPKVRVFDPAQEQDSQNQRHSLPGTSNSDANQDINEFAEEGKVGETPDFATANVAEVARGDQESPDQSDVEMEGTGDHSPVDSPLETADSPDDVPSQDDKKKTKPLGPNKPKQSFLCPVQGCKKPRPFAHKRDLKRHMLRKHKIKYQPDAHDEESGGQTVSNMEIDSPLESEQNENTPITGEVPGPAATTDTPMGEQVSRPEDRQRSESYEPPETTQPSAEQIAVSDVDSPLPNHAGDATAQATTEQLMLAQISDVSRARDKTQEIEAISTRQAQPSKAPPPMSRFTPYESPLRYFHAYRFHPQYNETVPGGLKSLTYSNRIDPSRELCPTELEGNACPLGEQCQFQHVGQLNAPDDQILLELGRADDYQGEQKGRFIQGLRELLQNFRANKVKDFDQIAQGIIAFRNSFLGDQSRILPLEGVTL